MGYGERGRQDDRRGGNLILRLIRELREQISGTDAKISGMDAKKDRVDARAVDVVRKVDAARLDIRDLGLQVALLETRMTRAVLGQQAS